MFTSAPKAVAASASPPASVRRGTAVRNMLVEYERSFAPQAAA